jgi:uncharacterized membrane protein
VANSLARFVIFACIALLWAAGVAPWLPTFVRLCAILPLVLFLPGFLLLRRLFPQRAVDFESIVLCVGTSVASTIVFGLVLHWCNALNASGWGAAVTLVALAALAQSLFGARQQGGESLFAASSLRPAGAWIASLGLVVVLLTGGISLAKYGAENHRQFTYSELWMLGENHHSDGRVTIGVKNDEQKPSVYDLEVLVNDKLLVRYPSFRLAEDEQLVKQVPIPVDLGIGQRVEARLYNHDAPFRIYRRAWLSSPDVVNR